MASKIDKQQIQDYKEQLVRETEAFSEHVQNLFANNELASKYLPFNEERSIYESFQDGILFGALLNAVKEGNIDINKLNKKIDASALNAPPPNGQNNATENTKGLFEATSNLNKCIDAAKNAGFVIVNLSAEDILAKKKDLVLGIVWQLIRAYLLQDININAHPELIRVLHPEEKLKDFLSLNNEQLLLRWFNYHLIKSNTSVRVNNFSKDISDSTAYLLLLKRIIPANLTSTHEIIEKGLNYSGDSNLERAKIVLEAVDTIGLRKFVTGNDIVTGSSRLNLAFTATLFDKFVGIFLPSDDEAKALYENNTTLTNENEKLRQRIKELEAENADLKSKLNEANSANSATNEDKSSLQIKYDQLAKEHESFSKDISDRLAVVRGLLSDHMKDVADDTTLSKKVNQLLGIEVTSPTTISAAPLSAISVNKTVAEQAESLSDELQSFVHAVLRENHEQIKIIAILAERAEQNNKINELLGEKIKDYSEHQIASNPIKKLKLPKKDKSKSKDNLSGSRDGLAS